MPLGNFLQGLAQAIGPISPGMLPQQNAMQPGAMPPGILPPQAPEPQMPAPRQRRSALDTIGQISDVLARVGGAQALYQPTLDGREDRSLALADHARSVDLDGLKRTLIEQQISGGNIEQAGAENTRLGQALRGVQAITANGGNAATAWPLIARQMGISDERAAAVGEAIGQEGMLEGLTTAFGKEGYGKQVFTGTDAQGNPVAYQVGADGQPHILSGITPADKQQFVNTGGATVGVGSLTGRARTVLPNTERPGAAADRTSRETIARENNAGRITVAGMPARAKPGTGTGGGEGGDLTKTQRGAVRQTLESVPGVTRTLDRVAALSNQMEREGTPASGFLGGRLPGSLSGKTAGEFDKAQALLMAQIRSLIRTVGEGSMSDYESRLNAAVTPARTDSAAGRAEAISNMRGLLKEIQGKSRRLLGTTTPAAAPGRRPTLTVPQRNIKPATGRGGTGGGTSGGWSVVGVK